MNDATVFPSLKYDDAHAAIDFLIKAFGAERHAVYTGDDNAVIHGGPVRIDHLPRQR